MNYAYRGMKLTEARSMIRYFLHSDTDFLIGMGVDTTKLPSETEWFDMLKEDFARPLQRRQFYYLIWLADVVPIGHCNINKIELSRLHSSILGKRLQTTARKLEQWT